MIQSSLVLKYEVVLSKGRVWYDCNESEVDMVTVHEVLTLKSFNAFRLIAGVNGLDRVVLKGGFIDHESSEDIRRSEFKNELVFSSLPMIKDKPEKIVDFVQALIDTNTAAFAVKSIFFQDIPEDAIQLANEHNYPLFSFDDTYIEELILDIDEIVNDQKYTFGVGYLFIQKEISCACS